MAEPSRGHPARRGRVRAIRSCTTVVVRDLRRSHASRGASTKVAAADRPHIRDRAGHRIGATLRLYHCSRRRHGGRSRISVDAQRRESASGVVPDHQPGHVPIRVQGRLRHYPSRLAGLPCNRRCPGPPSASRHWGESLIVSSRAIRAPSDDRGSRGLIRLVDSGLRILDAVRGGSGCENIFGQATQSTRRYVELCRRFRSRVRTAVAPAASV